MELIDQQVREMYELFPYPNYPLFAKPRWQEGYLASSTFSSALRDSDLNQLDQSRALPTPKEIIIGGAGEILPAVMAQWDGGKNIEAVDFSSRSLRRAKIRGLMSFQPCRYVLSEFEGYMSSQKKALRHVDVYGVLHHLANPTEVVEGLSRALLPGSTLRVMVYNSQARNWIHEVQAILRLTGLNPYKHCDLKLAKKIVEDIMLMTPVLRNFRSAMGNSTFSNHARFLDTFFHPREARLQWGQWQRAFENSGFKLLGLFDRYGELDDIENPMWQMPKAEDLEQRILSRQFENNFELFLVKTGAPQNTATFDKKKTFRKAYFKAPPKSWFTYEETKMLSMRTRYWLWHRYLDYVFYRRKIILDQLLAQRLEIATLKRLARIGVLFAAQIDDAELQTALSQPMIDDWQNESIASSHCEPADFAWIDQVINSRDLSRKNLRKKCIEKRLRRLASI